MVFNSPPAAPGSHAGVPLGVSAQLRSQVSPRIMDSVSRSFSLTSLVGNWRARALATSGSSASQAMPFSFGNVAR